MAQALYDPEPLARARRRQYASQAKFAERLGVTRNTVSRLENATDFSIPLLKRACGELGLKLIVSIVPDETSEKNLGGDPHSN